MISGMCLVCVGLVMGLFLYGAVRIYRGLKADREMEEWNKMFGWDE